METIRKPLVFVYFSEIKTVNRTICIKAGQLQIFLLRDKSKFTWWFLSHSHNLLPNSETGWWECTFFFYVPGPTQEKFKV